MSSGGEREQVIAAAWAVLGRSGFAGFKVQLVLREAGVSARSFYRHFSGKAELLLALMQEELARSAGLIAAASAEADSPPARVEIWLRSIISAAGAPHRAARARLFTQQGSVLGDFPDSFASAVQTLLEPLQAALREGVADGSFPDADVEHDTWAIHALAGALMTACLNDPVRYPLDQVMDAAVDFSLRALRAR